MTRETARKAALEFLRDNKAVVSLLVVLSAFNARQLAKAVGPFKADKKGCPQPGKALAEQTSADESLLWVPYKNRLAQVRVNHVPERTFDADYPKFAKKNSQFLDEVRALLGILFPRFRTKALGYLVLHMGLLGLRTYLSLIVAKLDGRIVRNIISANGPGFSRGLVEWLLLAVPASYTNAMIRFLEGRISLEFRMNLVRYIHDLYIGKNKEYYSLVNIDGAVEGVDHYITSDLTKFCDAAAKLYSNVGKPSLDLCIFAYQLSLNLGWKALGGIFINYFATAAVLKSLAPPFGKLASKENRLEGEYRNNHSRVITNAEEIAFYDGAEIERRSLREAYASLTKHVTKLLKIKAVYSVIEGYVLKYSWSASGFLFSSIPVFFPDVLGLTRVGPARRHDERENMGDYVTNKRIMLSIADAGGRIMYSIKDLAELAGYTQRVYQLIAALHRVRRKAYTSDKPGNYTLADVKGELVVDNEDEVSFNAVPIVVPGLGSELTNGEVLLDPLTLTVNEGQHLLITGSNGTGKSSIARISAGLWPVYRGVLKRSKDVAFLPQRPYFYNGTLRDQVTYPTTHDELIRRGVTDDDLHKILLKVNLAYLPGREGGLGAAKEWKDVLSGGEKQRMLFARILFQRPKFAVIDEGTSAVSADMEGLLYEELKAQGITLLTISHRISLLKYHSMKLEVGLGHDGTESSLEDTTGEKGWRSVDKEIEDLKKFLATVPALEKRHAEVVQLLKK